ncbi:hypothetical protein CDAR_207401 [Caerostris darwini]|uniref:Uncharacterized protein n=1 Tax=Caerostris darwini TaxID=1538125 RepID=A0AAV4VHE1_9ARAC|nr:hypothetical protein CDAR_207401 [Caerostris darwini]
MVNKVKLGSLSFKRQLTAFPVVSTLQETKCPNLVFERLRFMLNLKYCKNVDTIPNEGQVLPTSKSILIYTKMDTPVGWNILAEEQCKPFMPHLGVVIQI